MAVNGRYFSWTLTAGEDLADLRPRTGHLFRAIALDDGKIAQNGREAGGILLYGGLQGEHIAIGYAGIIKFLAGRPIEVGRHLTVLSDGSFAQAHPGDWVVGRCLDKAVASGAIGTGAFNFATTAYMGNPGEAALDYWDVLPDPTPSR